MTDFTHYQIAEKAMKQALTDYDDRDRDGAMIGLQAAQLHAILAVADALSAVTAALRGDDR